MTQQEYDHRMQDLNSQYARLVAPIRNQMVKIEAQKAVIDGHIDELRKQSRELGSRYYALCAQTKSIKNQINELKNELYIQRPARTADTAGSE